jgi:hypothetical protein
MDRRSHYRETVPMKRNDPPRLGAHYGATIRLLGPSVPTPVFHPASELEPIRNPFLPPEPAPQAEEVVDAEFESSSPDGELRRESDVWSNDAPSHRVTQTRTSGRMIAGSFLVFAVLGAGGFAALYSAVHAHDSTNRARYAADDSRGTMAPANENGGVPAIPPPGPSSAPLPEPSPALAAETAGAAAETAGAAARIDSGAPTLGAAATPTSARAEARHAAVAPPPAPPPPRIEMTPRKAPVVVHVEPAPVPRHRELDEPNEKDGPVSEDALLAGSARHAETPPPSTEPNAGAPRPTTPGAAPSSDALGGDSPPAEPIRPAPSARPEPVPPGNDPDDPRQ